MKSQFMSALNYQKYCIQDRPRPVNLTSSMAVVPTLRLLHLTQIDEEDELELVIYRRCLHVRHQVTDWSHRRLTVGEGRRVQDNI
jgi:hypothetical protein